MVMASNTQYGDTMLGFRRASMRMRLTVWTLLGVDAFSVQWTLSVHSLRFWRPLRVVSMVISLGNMDW